MKNLTVNGNLRCVQGQNISLTSGKIWVFGGFECGTFLGPFNAVKPFNGMQEITTVFIFQTSIILYVFINYLYRMLFF